MPAATMATHREFLSSEFIMVFRTVNPFSLLLRFGGKAPTKGGKENSARAVGELSVEFIQWQFEIR